MSPHTSPPGVTSLSTRRLRLEILVSIVAALSLPWASLAGGETGGTSTAPPAKGAGTLLGQVGEAKPGGEVTVRPPEKLHLQGVVTAVRPGEWLMLRTVAGSYEVALTAESAFRPGDKLAVEGEPQTRGGITRLVEAKFQRLSARPPLPPIELVHPEEATHGELISVQGRVRDVFHGKDRARLVLALEGVRASCTVFLEAPLDVASMELPRIGSLVRVEGPCLRRSMYWWLGSDLTIGSALGTKIETLAPAPYWNSSRLQVALWCVGVALVLVVGLGVWLWMRTSRQARRQGELRQSAAVSQERQRIAWELHDSLHQEIAAARMHLDNLKTAARLCPETVPELAEQTQAMLRHCEGETRNCVWDLRAGITGEFTLATTLQRWLKVRQPPEGKGTLEMRTAGEPLGLRRDQSFQILRIAQETVNNAMTHALAASIVVTLRRTADGVELLVEDDGRGFENSSRVDREGIHFGLTMLRERAARIRAQIQVRSELGVGTRLRLLLPDAELTHG